MNDHDDTQTDTPNTANDYAPMFAQMDALSLCYRLNCLADKEEGSGDHWNAALFREAAIRISPPEKTP